MAKYLTKFPKIILLIVTAFFLISFKSEEIDDKNYNTNLQIINSKNSKVRNFKVKIAKKQQERELGLMFVNNLPKNFGMVFEFEKEQMVYMWMKNTKIPLDMIFIDKDNRIIAIKHKAMPESLKTISSEKEVNKVLEINGGLCQKLDINIGDKIIVVSN